MLASGPMLTSPIKTAVGATKAVGAIVGFLPLYSIIMQVLTSVDCPNHDRGRKGRNQDLRRWTGRIGHSDQKPLCLAQFRSTDSASKSRNKGGTVEAQSDGAAAWPIPARDQAFN